ncbi:M23 family metallopeptidase [Thermus tengchongensis]|uniref:M23 family metallopeptidase n=1 Tax=Thermus tengchongensis TaxID=1214928 RepID=A0A4Y9FAG1_9DEIN|nr:M23 family metallopeptidase [Thermus tengchongensis]TFU26147.1 M23 family metallopeptidase [Thermus tengchongensis]
MRLIWPFPEPEKVRVDAGFLDPAYPRWRQNAGLPPAEHPGADLNVQGTSGDGDLGYPVVAIAEGRVVHARAHRVWGNIVLLEHDLPGLGRFWTQYAHLLFAVVREGDWVMAGEPVGSVGKGDPARPFLAHLHWEVRRSPIPPDAWPGMNRAYIQEHYLDPVAFVRQNYAPARRYYRVSVVLFNPTRQELGPGVVNLERPDLAQVALRRL